MSLRIFCTSIKPYSLLNKLPNYIEPLGLGENLFPKNWHDEKKGKNIGNLNKNYGELSGFYWVWKNLLSDFKSNDFIGFCHYRKLWLNFILEKKNKKSAKSLYSDLLDPDNILLDNVDVVQVQPIEFLNKNLFQDFEIVHKNNMLKISLEFLKEPIKSNFFNFLQNNKLYPLNMFITKKNIFEEYCNIIFPWLNSNYNFCLQKNLLRDYNIRLPAFLAERFTSFWFSQYKNRYCLSYARLGNFFLSEKINNFLNPLKIPFTTRLYPTIHKF